MRVRTIACKGTVPETDFEHPIQHLHRAEKLDKSINLTAHTGIFARRPQEMSTDLDLSIACMHDWKEQAALARYCN